MLVVVLLIYLSIHPFVLVSLRLAVPCMLVFVGSCLVLAIVVVVVVQNRLLVVTHVDDFVVSHLSNSRTSLSDRVILSSMFLFLFLIVLASILCSQVPHESVSSFDISSWSFS